MTDASATLATQEEAAVRRTLQNYVDGLREGNTELLREAFHPQAIMTGYLGPDPMIVPIEKLYDLVEENPSPAESGAPFDAQIRSVQVIGNTATGVVTEQGYLGHDFQDSLQLLKLDGEWRIMAKIFTTL